MLCRKPPRGMFFHLLSLKVVLFPYAAQWAFLLCCLPLHNHLPYLPFFCCLFLHRTEDLPCRIYLPNRADDDSSTRRCCGIVWRLPQQSQSPSESARLANGKYHRPFGVVSKCALREKKEEGPRFPGDLPTDSIVLRQLLYQVILQYIQFHLGYAKIRCSAGMSLMPWYTSLKSPLRVR